MKTLNEFFYFLDNDVDKIRDYLSEDFMIFEVSRKWDTEEFIEFVKGFGEFESKRDFKNVIIDTDLNSAHITLEHTGEFELKKPTPEGITNLSYDQFKFSLVFFISSSPKGAPWEEDFPDLLGEPNPITVLQEINVGLLDFRDLLIALSICFSLWPFISIKFHP